MTIQEERGIITEVYEIPDFVNNYDKNMEAQNEAYTDTDKGNNRNKISFG